MPKILLVEDNEIVRELTLDWLTRWGYEVTIAVDGEEALTKAHSENPDLILMDLGLPKIDGWEATRRLKSDDATSHVPIIAITGYAVGDLLDKALAAGCDDYCVKPTDFEHLRVMIETLLQRTALPDG